MGQLPFTIATPAPSEAVLKHTLITPYFTGFKYGELGPMLAEPHR